MPPIVSIENTVSGIRIVCADKSIGNQGVVTATRTDLPGNLRTSTDTAAIETFINNFLKTALTWTDGNGETRWKFYAVVHVFSNTGGVLNITSLAMDWNGLASAAVPAVGTWW